MDEPSGKNKERNICEKLHEQKISFAGLTLTELRKTYKQKFPLFSLGSAKTIQSLPGLFFQKRFDDFFYEVAVA
ncbi:MAG: hypothetical protein WC626_05010 [Methanoregula sp.]